MAMKHKPINRGTTQTGIKKYSEQPMIYKTYTLN